VTAATTERKPTGQEFPRETGCQADSRYFNQKKFKRKTNSNFLDMIFWVSGKEMTGTADDMIAAYS